jgi:uncharacterized protein YbbC (DUF1343 family)
MTADHPINTIKSFVFFVIFLISCQHSSSQTAPNINVKPGIEVLLEKHTPLITGKKIGLITNPTGITSYFQSTIDALYNAPNVQLVALFGPEHGVRGNIEAGKLVSNFTDEKTGLPVYSLYGKNSAAMAEMFTNINLLIYDIQDIGSRAYTFIYTLASAMEAAKTKNIQMVVLDRPNPLGGNRVEGPVLDPAFKSTIGRYPIPYIYGMTVGELAKLFNDEFNIHCQLTVIPMEGWQRDMYYDETGLPWVPTSPHIPHAETALFEATTGNIGELETLSIGVGYTLPFEVVGAPWIDSEELAQQLNKCQLAGAWFRQLYFKPYYLRFQDQPCRGVQIYILDRSQFSPLTVQLHVLEAIRQLYPQQILFNGKNFIKMFDFAWGTDQVRKNIETGVPANFTVASWEAGLEKFRAMREKYLIYLH